MAGAAYYKDLIADAQEPMGPAPFFQVVGMTYNPDKVKTPPTSWADMWKPEYKGRVGITNLNSTLGTGFLVEIARMHGGSEANVDAGFKAIEELKPNIAAVAANPGQLATLYQQGQIDIGPATSTPSRSSRRAACRSSSSRRRRVRSPSRPPSTSSRTRPTRSWPPS